jgi:tetratricopeptide (TPR) repeat protein
MSDFKIDLSRSGARLAAFAAMVLAFGAGIYSAIAFFANAAASRAAYKEIAALAVSFAPADPQTRYAHAVLLEKTFFPDDLQLSLREFENAVALSPNDPDLWLELGRARDRAGDAEGAEAALRRALALAPNYARTRWSLGNSLLRQNRTDEAFDLIRRAAEADPQYAEPAITNAWQVYRDLDVVRRLAGDSVPMRAALAAYLARDKKFAEAVEVWQSLPETDRATAFRGNGEEIVRQMLEARRFRDAVQMSGGRFRIGELANGSFEGPFTLQGPSVFEWRLGSGGEPQIAVDATVTRDGELSLVLLFNGSDAKAMRGVSQTVAVDAGKNYALRGFYRADLRAMQTFRWVVTNAADGRTLAEAPAIEARTDWNEFAVNFTVPHDAEAIVVDLRPAACAAPLCQLTGRVWFDGMSITEVRK